MITERKEDLEQVGAEDFIEKMLEKYFISFVGDRDGNIHGQAERYPGPDSEEVGVIDQRATGG